MGQALRNKFNGCKQEVLRDVELYGWWEAMDRHGVKDYIAFSRFIEEETGNPNFGRNPKFNPANGQDLGDQIVTAMVSYISRNQAEMESMRKRLEFVEYQLKHKGMDNKEKVACLLEAFGT